LLLAEFNVKNNITGMVMWKKILIDRISYNNGMMAYCVPLRKIEDRSNGRVEVVYTPFISKKELLEANKKYQKEVREIQERILRLNMQEIDLPFDI
jgi:predicted DNA-binding antitoxin AbrB/MazE fold protein